MKDDFEFLRGLANCQDKEQMARYIEEHQPKPMTNADKIRAMTDEELAYWIMCPYDSPYCTGTDRCIECTLEWLKQPAEDDC